MEERLGSVEKVRVKMQHEMESVKRKLEKLSMLEKSMGILLEYMSAFDKVELLLQKLDKQKKYGSSQRGSKRMPEVGLATKPMKRMAIVVDWVKDRRRRGYSI